VKERRGEEMMGRESRRGEEKERDKEGERRGGEKESKK